jgi:hypothetical protein
MTIQQPHVRTKTYSDKRFDKTASTFWNNLPSETQNEQSLDILWWLKKYDQIYNKEYFFTTCSEFKGLQIYTLPIHCKGE